MSATQTLGRFSAPGGAKRIALLVTLAATLLSAGWAVSQSVEKASAYDFCPNVWLAPKGQPSSECGESFLTHVLMDQVHAIEHSSCVAAITYDYHFWGTGWYCTPGPESYRTIYLSDEWGESPWVARRGIIRNNTIGGFTHAYGVQLS
jgi:hypothetical protein